MKQSSKRSLSMLIGAALIILSLFAFFDLVQPEYQHFSGLKGQVVAQQNFLALEQKSVDQAQKIIAKYQSETDARQTVNLAVPSNLDTAGAIAQIYGIATNNGVVIKGLTIAPPTLQPSAAAATTDSAGNPVVSIVKPLGAYMIQLNAAGSYESFKNFIQGLETNVRIFDVKGVSLQTATEQAVAGGTTIGSKGPVTLANPDFFDYTITVAAYYQAQ